MRAIQITQTGGPEVLVLRELPTPEPGPGQVLIQIEACGVNFIDVYLREGRYPVAAAVYPRPGGSGNGDRAGAGRHLGSRSATGSPGATSWAPTPSMPSRPCPG